MRALEGRQNGHNRAAWFTLRELNLIGSSSSDSRLRSVRRAVDRLVKDQLLEKSYVSAAAFSRSGLPLRRDPDAYIERRLALCIRLYCDSGQHDEDLSEWVFFMTSRAMAYEQSDVADAPERATRIWAELDALSGCEPTQTKSA